MYFILILILFLAPYVMFTVSLHQHAIEYFCITICYQSDMKYKYNKHWPVFPKFIPINVDYRKVKPLKSQSQRRQLLSFVYFTFSFTITITWHRYRYSYCEALRSIAVRLPQYDQPEHVTMSRSWGAAFCDKIVHDVHDYSVVKLEPSDLITYLYHKHKSNI